MNSTRFKTMLLPVRSHAGEETHLRIDLYYDLGGYNVFTYKTDPRGYYASFLPVKREVHTHYTSESFVGFSGFKVLLKEVTRQSKKARTEALEEFIADLPQWLDACETKYHFTIDRSELEKEVAA